jgi:hypothetical protein
MRLIETFQEQSADFVQVVELDEIIVSLRLTFNVRNETWFINEYLETETEKALYGIKVTKEFPLIWPLKTQIDLPGDFMVIKRDEDVEDEITYDNFNNGWDLFYLTQEEVNTWFSENGL